MAFNFTQKDLSDFYRRLDRIYSESNFDVENPADFQKLSNEYFRTLRLFSPAYSTDITQVFIVFTISRANLRIRSENIPKGDADIPIAIPVHESTTPVAVNVAPAESSTHVRHEYHYHHYNAPRYQSDNSNFWFWMYLMESMKTRASASARSAPPPAPHQSNESQSKKSTQSWIPLLLITGGAAFLAYVTFYYVAAQWLDSIERLYYNEGKGAALMGLSLMSAVAGFSAYFLVLPIQQSILAMALTTGLSTALALALAIFVALCSLIVFSFLGMVVTQSLQRLIQNHTENEQTLDARDPERFRLTVEEEQRLKDKHYDPAIVKCAIVEILLQMDKQATDNDKVSLYTPSLFTPLSQYQREQIKLIRGLRAGNEAAMKQVLNLRGEGAQEKAQFNFSDDANNPQSYEAITQPSAPSAPGC